MELNNLLESANPWKSMQGDAARLTEKWEKTGLLEGINSDVETNNMSMILENQAKQLVVEQSQTGGTANFTPGTGATWAGVALPLVRKVFGQLASKEFVSVQPMNLPSGLVFYLDFQYGTDKAPFADGDSMYGDTDGVGAANGGLYGPGKFTYSENLFTASFVEGDYSSGSLSGEAGWAAVGFDAALSASATQDLAFITVQATDLDEPDVHGVRGFIIDNADLDDLYQAYTNYDAATGEITFYGTGSIGTTPAGALAITYSKQPTDNERGDFEAGNSFATDANYGGGSEIEIPEVNVAMNSEAIVAKTRKLKAQWTPEFAQDLNAYHSLDAEAELTSIMSEYISLEIDLEILAMLKESAPTVEYWSAQNNVALDGSGIASADLGFLNTQGGWFQTLGTKVQKVSNTIHQKTMRGGANFMVVSPSIATVIESIPGYASDSNGDKETFAFGIQKAGSLNGRYKVYKNPYQQDNMILMGYRGSQFLECGAVFAPYIPLIMTPLVYDPDTFTPRKGLLTRYAKKMIRPEFYGRVFVSNTNLI